MAASFDLRPCLPLLAIGVVNTLVCYAVWEARLEWKLGIAAMAILTAAAGYCTTEQTWGAVVVVLMPCLFLGSERHGRGVDLLLFPPLWIYLLLQLWPAIVADLVLVWIGQWLRRRVGRRATVPSGRGE